MFFFSAFCRAVERFCAVRTLGFILVLAIAGTEERMQIATTLAVSFFVIASIPRILTQTAPVENGVDFAVGSSSGR